MLSGFLFRKAVFVCLIMILALTSLSSKAGNVLIRKVPNGIAGLDKTSFEATEYNASVSHFEWTQVFAVCREDCVFSGFNGVITDLIVDGILLHKGNAEVNTSTIRIDKYGDIKIYLAPQSIVLALTREQIRMLENEAQ